MANNRTANTYYIDTVYASSVSTTTELQIPNLRVKYVVMTATAAAAQLVLSDSSTARLDLRIAASTSSQVFDFVDFPIVFNSTLRPSTLTNAVATVVFEEARK